MDLLFARRGERMLPLPVTAGLDWSAHLATTVLVLRGTVPRSRLEALATPALLASVAVDADHIPQALAGLIKPDQQRPATHHPAVVLVPLAAAAALRGRARARAAGVALGLAGHFTRDLFNGPGLRGVRLPVWVEGVALAALVARAARRPGR